MTEICHYCDVAIGPDELMKPIYLNGEADRKRHVHVALEVCIERLRAEVADLLALLSEAINTYILETPHGRTDHDLVARVRAIQAKIALCERVAQGGGNG